MDAATLGTPLAPHLADALCRPFVAVVGKGGSGRTLLAAALAQHNARRQRRTLLCTQSARHPFRIEQTLPPGRIEDCEPHLSVLRSSPRHARDEYVLQVLKSPKLYRLFFTNRHINHFFDAIPGLAEWAILGKATWHALPSTPKEERYDTVILDAPATGHGLDMLKLSDVIATTTPRGRIRTEALERTALLRDPQRCAIIPTALLETLAVNETIELVAELKAHQFPTPLVVANRVLDVLFHDGDAPCSDEALAHLTAPQPPPWAHAAALQYKRHQEQRAQLDKLRAGTQLPIRALPIIDVAGCTESRLDAAQHFLLHGTPS